MLIKYYKSKDLAYSNRKRYRTFNYVADSEEEQNAVKLGDGERTTVTTKASNICNYVKQLRDEGRVKVLNAREYYEYHYHRNILIYTQT